MSKQRIEAVGKVYGLLTVTKDTRVTSYGHRYVEAVCECGKVKEYKLYHLTGKKTISCGTCSKISHGMTGTRAYKAWQNIQGRCHTHKHYLKQRITFCDRWKKFENFLEDMGEPPKGLTLDRIDTLGNYEKSNCRWVSMKIQSRNRIRQCNNITSQYKGVYRMNKERLKPWVARITVNGEKQHLGVFANERDAAIAYNNEAAKHEGFRLNEVQ